MNTLRTIALISVLLFSGTCAAEGPASAAQQEISHLFAYLGGSGCQFNRNGTWYGPHEAADHLNDKYQYLLGKNRIASAEDFIDQAASQSSMSGQPYLVKCGSAAPVASSSWFRAELEKYRKATLKASSRQ
jgi:hypothetical protein